MPLRYSNIRKHKQELYNFDEVFFEDTSDLFSELRSGHLGKYIYGGNTINDDQDMWEKVVDKNNKGYYLPSEDSDLLAIATDKLSLVIPEYTPIVDFGVGELSAFDKNIKPLLNVINSNEYYGIDCCQSYLEAIKKVEPFLKNVKIHVINADFFSPNLKSVSNVPSIGVMLCSTIGNIGAPLKTNDLSKILSDHLRMLSKITKNGWLLMSVDTNHDKLSLMNGYNTETIAKFVLTVLHRIAQELPTNGFNPNLFRYAPEWHAESQQFAHIAQATDGQGFTLGAYRFQIVKGQKLHLLNSFKFSPTFFESACDKANLDVLHIWHHESPMKLYLLKDRANTLSATGSEQEHAVA